MALCKYCGKKLRPNYLTPRGLKMVIKRLRDSAEKAKSDLNPNGDRYYLNHIRDIEERYRKENGRLTWDGHFCNSLCASAFGLACAKGGVVLKKKGDNDDRMDWQ